jgi:hypothetical protein
MINEELISHIELSLFKANNNITKLPQEVFDLPGMSGRCNRIFLNELLSIPGRRYLEVGCWKGSTAISALYDNDFSQAVLIDNFSEFNTPSPEEEFINNLNRFKEHLHGKIIFNKKDCFSIVLNDHFNIYFYDGTHTVETQKKAFTYFDSILENRFIAVVDDWNWDYVREGTFQAFEELQYKIIKQWDIFTPGNNSKNWHNGLFIAIIEH